MFKPEKNRKPALGRRRFFKSFIGETASMVDELRGIPQFRLDNLQDLADEVLSQIKPALLPGVEIDIEDDRVIARKQGKEESLFLFRSETEAAFVFNTFNGINTIGQISENLVNTMGWQQEEAFSYTKTFFLKMVRLRVCAPANPVG